MMREQKALRRKQEKEEKKALKAEQVSKKLSMQMDKKSPWRLTSLLLPTKSPSNKSHFCIILRPYISFHSSLWFFPTVIKYL